MNKNVLYFLLALLLATFIGIVSFIALFVLFCTIFPPVYVEPNGIRHATMPIAHFLSSAFLGTVIGLISLFFIFRKLKRQISKK